ncbi:hypothetical protein [Mycobacterium tilburgii]|uniref:hypothetical protein n=1 Tax=Mycobacterium tilburgii TaxID=44467 RepID=UPI00118359AD|nr:hypothetical protein [Mycobacterium tilburgii]
MESAAAVTMCFASMDHDLAEFFENLSAALLHYYDTGSVTDLRNPLAILAAMLDRLGHHEAAGQRSADSPRLTGHAQPSPRSTRRLRTCAKSSATRPMNHSHNMVR